MFGWYRSTLLLLQHSLTWVFFRTVLYFRTHEVIQKEPFSTSLTLTLCTSHFTHQLKKALPQPAKPSLNFFSRPRLSASLKFPLPFFAFSILSSSSPFFPSLLPLNPRGSLGAARNSKSHHPVRGTSSSQPGLSPSRPRRPFAPLSVVRFSLPYNPPAERLSRALPQRFLSPRLTKTHRLADFVLLWSIAQPRQLNQSPGLQHPSSFFSALLI
jgi:hypothetical protein